MHLCTQSALLKGLSKISKTKLQNLFWKGFTDFKHSREYTYFENLLKQNVLVEILVKNFSHVL